MEDYECSSSDSDDEEYIPEGEGGSSGSDVSEGELEDNPVVTSGGVVKKKRQVRRQRKPRPLANSRKRKGGIHLEGTRGSVGEAKSDEEVHGEEEREEGVSHEKEEKKEKERIDNLWAMFKSDTTAPKPKSSEEKNNGRNAQSTHTEGSQKDTPKTVKIKKAYDFAGEEVVVEKEVAADSKEAKKFLETKSQPKDTQEPEQTAKQSSTCTDSQHIGSTTISIAPSASPVTTIGSKRSSGLSSLLQSLSKKPKMSTLEKSHLDWQKYKQAEGLEEELLQHNKDGYLAKQAFLQEADVRQFELEKEERLKRFKRLTSISLITFPITF